MQSSNFRLSFVLIACVLMIGCTKADTKPDGVNGNVGIEGTASFRIAKLDGDATLLSVPDNFTDAKTGVTFMSTWRVPTFASFRFTACVLDRATRAEAVGHKFDVEIPGRGRLEDIRPTSDGGCFSWFESLPFNYFVKRSRWAVIERDIVGTGIHTGRQRVRIAVNPWAAAANPTRDSGDQVRFLRDRPLHPSQLVDVAQADAALSGDLLGNDTLFADDVQIQVLRRGESSKGTFYRFNVTMHPKVRFENQAGVAQLVPINTGDFFVVGHIVVTDAGSDLKKRTIITTGRELPKEFAQKGDLGVLGQGRVIDGKLVVRLDAWVEARLAQGNMELAIKLIPKGVRGVGEFHGIYELGSIKNMSSGFSGTLSEACRERGPCNVTEYLKTAENIDKLKASGEATDAFPYFLDRIKLRFVQVQPGETTTERTVGYSASICVSDVHTGDRPVGLKFNVRYKDTGEVHSLKTEGDGCLYWSSNIFHRYYHPEEFIEKVVSIEKETGVKKEVKFHINPWDDKFTFGFDEIEFLPEFWAELKRRKKVPSRFFLSSYGYHTVRFQYNIDSLMGLEVKKTVLMEMSPRVLRYSGIINARKMTEPTRDGIWLMKTALQKNYLDPSQMNLYIDQLKDARAQLRLKNESPEAQKVNSSNRLRKLGIDVPSKEYISTRTALIRSTDGVIVQPVELSMQDLRLMRVRSNFLIQLEPVDERQLQAHNVLHAGFSKTVTELIAERKAKSDLLGKTPDEKPEEQILAEEEARIKKIIAERVGLTRKLFDEIGTQLYSQGRFQINLAPYELSPEALEYVKPLLEKLQLELDINDFTNIKLPTCAEIDCQRFIAPDSGLEKRTFVGPVIFLSNGYSDSVRATDNLDEARCGQQVEFDDEFEQSLREEERRLFMQAEDLVTPVRDNAIYRYSEYFGSLRHLCYKHVDELITREKEDKRLYEVNQPAIASVFNLVRAYHMDYVSLTDQKPKNVEITDESLARCNNDLPSCMEETTEFWKPVSTILGFVERNLDLSDRMDRGWLGEFFNGKDELRVKSEPWNVNDMAMALFGKHKNWKMRRFAGCAIVVGNFVDQFRESRPALQFTHSYGAIEESMMRECLASREEPILFDRKMRVVKSGQSGDSYVFLGGYQMNINVGQSFSVSHSNSYSRGWGVEATDMVMPFLKGFGPLASALKPFSYKISGSESNATSDGTTVSESTYLVAQIAKFRVRLDEFERCVGLKFTTQFMDRLKYAQAFVHSSLRMNPEAVASTRPLFICEGRVETTPEYVDEMYFYFTQHFTEGDMLDQADLYNHPWLLALRGYRDFFTFVNSIRAQEVLSWTDAITGGGGFAPKTRDVDWPLKHMRETYLQMMPSFPGFYTVLDKGGGEGLTEFPLEKRLEMTDPDINGEVPKGYKDAPKAVPGEN